MHPEDETSQKYLRNNDPFRQTDPDESEIAYLLQNLKPDDKELLGRLVARYTANLQRWVEVLLTSPGKNKPPLEEIRSITQEIYINALRQVDQFHGQASVNHWLFSIAYKIVRIYKRRRMLKMSFRRIDDSTELWFQPSDHRMAYWESVDRLPDKLRLPLILRYLFDFEISDIGYIFSTSEKDIHFRLSSARQNLLINLSKPHLRRQVQARMDDLLNDDRQALNHWMII